MDQKTSFAGKLLLPLLALASSACAATTAAAPAPETPRTSPPPLVAPASALSAEAFVIDGPVREEWIPLLKPSAVDPAKAKLLAPPPGLAALPAACDAFATRKGEGKASCADPTAALAALDAALGRATPEQRDAALVDLDGCAGLPAGIARAVRAELAPIECAESIVEPFLKAPPPATNGIVYGAMLGQAIAGRLARTAHDPPTLPLPHDKAHVLAFVKGPMFAWFEQQALAIESIVEPFLKAPPPATNGIVYGAMLGQAIAGRLARTAHDPPTLPLPHDKARVLAFVKGPMFAWFEQQALAIESISQAAAELPYYGKGIAAVEAGVADLRLVEAVRGGPVPDEFKKDEELRNIYYGNLDQLLDPRKDRGRDAALVGLKELSLVGVIRDARVDRARVMLSRLYGGRRIDALDTLLLPQLPPAAPASVEERLAARLPTLYAGLLLDEQAASRAGTLRQLLDRGVPLPQRMALRKAQLTPEARALYARAHLELGRLYWRAVDFDQAAALAASARADRSDDATFTLALALALRGGPEDAADMMRKAPRALPAPRTTALDAIAAQTPPSPGAGFAAFDAALLHQLGSPEGSGASYWSDVAQRFHAAAARLTVPAQRAVAEDRAKAAEDVARAVAGK